MPLDTTTLRSRRTLLLGAVSGLAAVAAQLIARPLPAAAGGGSLVLGSSGNVSQGSTGIAASPPAGPGVYGFGVTDGGLGGFPQSAAIAGHGDTTFPVGVYGHHPAGGNGVWGDAGGTNGWGVAGIALDDTGTGGIGVHGINEAAGFGVVGESNHGRGARFMGPKAQVQLHPNSAATHPARGQRGDLFVDSAGRLWYCRKGGTSSVWKQLA